MFPFLPLPLPGGALVQIPLHGLLVLAGLLAAWWWAARRARAAAWPRRDLLIIAIAALIAGVIGARVWGMIEYPHPAGFWRGLLRLDEGGSVLAGALLAGAMTGLVMARRQQRSWRLLGGIWAPPLLLALALGRIGCLANGCCAGRPAALPWCFAQDHAHRVERGDDGLALTTAASFAARHGERGPCHPVQIYEALAALLLALGLARRPLDERGRTLALALIGYGIWRLVAEQWRDDDRLLAQFAGLRLTASALFAAVLVAAGGAILRRA